MNALVRKIAALLVVIVFIGNIVTPIAADAAFGSFSDDTQENFENGVVMCAATAAILMIISEIAGALNVPTNDVPTNIKETILDCLFWAFKNAIIQEVTGSTVQWIQEGMNGNPAFVQNVGLYLRSVADREFGSYIEKVAPYLCSPFRADIQLQLNSLYKNSSDRGPVGVNGYSCTLTESVDNVDAFLAGNFNAGGWAGWQSMFSNPLNNPYGAYFEGRDELALRISSATGEATKKLDLGNGFFSKEVQNCYSTTGERLTEEEIELWGVENLECEPPTIVTPGSQIKNSLEAAFGVNLDQIASADEFDEIFNLLAAWLISDILTEEGGLAGYDPSAIDHELPPPPVGGDLDDPTAGDSEPPGPPGPSLCFEKNGTFLTPTRGGTLTTGFSFGVPQNVSYDRIELEIDVTNNGWPEDRGGWPVGIFWMGRPGNKNMFGYSKVNAPGGGNGSRLMLAHGIGMSHSYKTRVFGNNFQWPEGATYRFSYVYNAAGQAVSLRVTDASTGTVVRTLTSTPTVPGINTGNEIFRLTFGYSETEANPKERPLYGWRYSDLKVSFLSGNEQPGSCTTPSQSGGGTDRPSDGEDGGGGGGDNNDSSQAF